MLHGLKKQLKAVGYYAVEGIEVEVTAEASRDGVSVIASFPVEDPNHRLSFFTVDRLLTWDELDSAGRDWRQIADDFAKELVAVATK